MSFLAYYGGDKFLLDTILDVYASLQDQADIASSLAPVTDSNGMEASEVMKEKVKLSPFVLSSEREKNLFLVYLSLTSVIPGQCCIQGTRME